MQNDPERGPLASLQDPDIDFGEQNADKSGESPVADRLARGNRALDDANALRDAPGLDQRDAARPLENVVEHAKPLELDG